jgi:hypothetical protein
MRARLRSSRATALSASRSEPVIAPEQWHVAATIGLGLVALAVGLLEGASFLHPSSSRSFQQPRPGLPTSRPSVPGWPLLVSEGWATSSRAASCPPIQQSGAGGRLRDAAVIGCAGGIC